jgi:hypothetical protein
LIKACGLSKTKPRAQKNNKISIFGSTEKLFRLVQPSLVCTRHTSSITFCKEKKEKE